MIGKISCSGSKDHVMNIGMSHGNGHSNFDQAKNGLLMSKWCSQITSRDVSHPAFGQMRFDI